ncbi:MAG: hypothetical protein CSA19_00400 [Deltaproteobacteria bacterium]|nr:MAG: hypothetical protein CSA19_00400 [Deltaproteobacteria bacterium]
MSTHKILQRRLDESLKLLQISYKIFKHSTLRHKIFTTNDNLSSDAPKLLSRSYQILRRQD